MATFNNFLEEGRPPDSPSSNRKCHPRTHFNSWTYNQSSDNVNNNLTLDINLNQQVHHNLKTKLLCINTTKRKSDTSASSIKLCDTNNTNNISSQPSKRSSFHQDVEEALQSLLWQPYEYQVTPADQWKCGAQSRELVSGSASRLSSGEEASLLEVLDDGETARRVSVSSDCGDVCTSDSDMHLEVTAAHNPDHLLNIGHEDGLSSANVVGLPEASPLVPPNHSRNGSEPSTAGFRLVPTHPRSASVPKSLGSLTPKKTMSVNNISNVNVNFYRAVPVNVVSAVPTIQCLNTMNEGNNVSNVQIMPLGSTTTPVSTGTVAKVFLRFTQLIDYLIDRMIGFFVEHLLGYGPLFGHHRPTDV